MITLGMAMGVKDSGVEEPSRSALLERWEIQPTRKAKTDNDRRGHRAENGGIL